MSSYLYRVGVFVVRMRWWVIAGWLVLAVVGGLLAQVLGGSLQTTFQIPGTPAQTALDTAQQRFPQIAGTSVRVVMSTPDGTPIAADEDAVASVCAALAEVPGAAAVSCPVAVPATASEPATAPRPDQVAPGGDIAYASLSLESADPPASAGLQVAYAGLPADAAAGVDWTELAGLAIAFIILAITFGSVVAAGVPLVTAVGGVTLASSGILVVAALAPVSSTAPLLATMLGLAVGIDYALLIVSRHRAQVASGMAVRESIPVAVATAGTAVLFAGMTVIVALLGLGVAGIPFLSVMGLGAAAAVAVALGVAITLLPALLAVLGRSLAPRHPAPRAAGRPPRWARLATRNPITTILVVGIALLVSALPAVGLRLTLPDAGYDPPGSTARVAYDRLAEGFGPGINGPLLVIADISGTLEVEQALTALENGFVGIPGIAAVSAAYPNQGLDLAVLTITPDSAPSSSATSALVAGIRAAEPSFAARTGFGYAVTGQTALAIDISARLSNALVPFALVVVGLCLVLLTIMFRSLIVPVVATGGYLLSVAASLGATTAVFEWGWGASLLGVAKVGPVISFLPILVMAVLFGLAMDYHVFLVSRMRERFAATGDARGAVLEGFAAAARVVTAAALIMFAVFFSFVPGGNAIIQPLAFALAIGVLIDAFLVRMTLVPAVMALLGARVWWLPAWLSRVLPDADIEGEAVDRMLRQREWAGGEAAGGIAVRGWSVPGCEPVDAVAGPGSVLVIAGGPGAVARAVAALAGRYAGTRGDAVVRGRLLPFDHEAVAAMSAYVPARPLEPDATTLGEYVERAVAAARVPARGRPAAVRRAVAVFDRLVPVLTGRPVVVTVRTPLADLPEALRWAAAAAVAVAAAPRVIAIDVTAAADPTAVATVLAASAPPTSILVIGGEVAPVTVRPVVGMTLRERTGTMGRALR